VDLSRLHGVLKDKTRAAILLTLDQKGTLSYSEILQSLEIRHTGKLNYHLKVLGDLVGKDGLTGRYSLTEKGKVAVALLGKFRVEARRRPEGVLVLGALMILVGVGEVLYSTPSLAGLISEFRLINENFAGPLAAHVTPAPPSALLLFEVWLSLLLALLPLYASFMAIGAGLLYSKLWAWGAAVAVFALTICLILSQGLVFVAMVMVDASASNPPGLTLGLTIQLLTLVAYTAGPATVGASLSLYYLTRSRVKAFFGRSPPLPEAPLLGKNLTSPEDGAVKA